MGLDRLGNDKRHMASGFGWKDGSVERGGSGFGRGIDLEVGVKA
jgi:hypothetical protein